MYVRVSWNYAQLRRRTFFKSWKRCFQHKERSDVNAWHVGETFGEASTKLCYDKIGQSISFLDALSQTTIVGLKQAFGSDGPSLAEGERFRMNLLPDEPISSKVYSFSYGTANNARISSVLARPSHGGKKENTYQETLLCIMS